MKEKKLLGGRDKVKVAVVQAAPVFLDKERTIEKACRLIAEAGKNGAELIAFPETFVPGYPAVYTAGWDNKPAEWAPYMIALQDNSIVIDSGDTEVLGRAAREAGAYVVMGCNELDGRSGSRTIYNTLIFISREGRVMGRHRKLIPTYSELPYWGHGDGSDLRVFDTDIGRIGGLICGENLIVLVKAAMMHQGEEFHVTVWPGAWSGHGRDHLMDAETDPGGGDCLIYPTIRCYALEAQAFVLSANGVLTEKDFPDRWKSLANSAHMNYNWEVGGSAVVNPHGRIVAGPSLGGETILYADCYANQIKLAKAFFDCLGRYARWDVTRLEVRKHPWTPDVPAAGQVPVEVPSAEIRRIAEEYEVSASKLEGIIVRLNGLGCCQEGD